MDNFCDAGRRLHLAKLDTGPFEVQKSISRACPLSGQLYEHQLRLLGKQFYLRFRLLVIHPTAALVFRCLTYLHLRL